MNYEIRRREDGREAIFDKDGSQISDWFDWIGTYGLIRGQSRYYIAKKNKKMAIFDKNGDRISNWFDEIYSVGLVKGESDYYIVRENGKDAIFDKEGSQISQWHDWIFSYGLVEGKSDYYITCKDKKCAVYYKNGQKVSDDLIIVHLEELENVIFNENLGIAEMFSENGKLLETIEFSPVIHREEIIDYTKLLNI